MKTIMRHILHYVSCAEYARLTILAAKRAPEDEKSWQREMLELTFQNTVLCFRGAVCTSMRRKIDYLGCQHSQPWRAKQSILQAKKVNVEAQKTLFWAIILRFSHDKKPSLEVLHDITCCAATYYTNLKIQGLEGAARGSDGFNAILRRLKRLSARSWNDFVRNDKKQDKVGFSWRYERKREVFRDTKGLRTGQCNDWKRQRLKSGRHNDTDAAEKAHDNSEKRKVNTRNGKSVGKSKKRS